MLNVSSYAHKRNYVYPHKYIVNVKNSVLKLQKIATEWKIQSLSWKMNKIHLRKYTDQHEYTFRTDHKFKCNLHYSNLKAYKHYACFRMLPNVEMPDMIYSISYNILIINRNKHFFIQLQNSLPQFAFICLIFRDIAARQFINKSQIKKPITDTQLVSQQKNVIQVDG
jgi:hypothetical protein